MEDKPVSTSLSFNLQQPTMKMLFELQERFRLDTEGLLEKLICEAYKDIPPNQTNQFRRAVFLLKDPHASVVDLTKAIKYLSVHGDRQLVPRLIDLLRHEDKEVRKGSAGALEAIFNRN